MKDQELQNALAALDTRVTNAINGGDLAPKVTIDLLNAPYTDSTNSSYAVQVLSVMLKIAPRKEFGIIQSKLLKE